jgi:hypothetical protein
MPSLLISCYMIMSDKQTNSIDADSVFVKVFYCMNTISRIMAASNIETRYILEGRID